MLTIQSSITIPTTNLGQDNCEQAASSVQPEIDYEHTLKLMSNNQMYEGICVDDPIIQVVQFAPMIC